MSKGKKTDSINNKLLKSFPIEVEGVGTFTTLKEFMNYCNVGRDVVQRAFTDHPENWIEVIVSKDTGPYYVNGVEYANRNRLADRLEIPSKTLVNNVNNHGYSKIQDYIDYLEDTMVYYNGTPIYSSSTLSSLTDMGVKTCGGILRQVRKIVDDEERQETMNKLIESRKELITVIKNIDCTMKSIADFMKKYRVTKQCLERVENMDKPLEYKLQYLRGITNEVIYKEA